jgi:2-polyprenyl-3-methyl-5-hydroxy-6-metoxy-1,4-benzoquinol methylase
VLPGANSAKAKTMKKGMEQQANAPREEYWSAHYEAFHPHAPSWLDYSNERVQVQSFALALDACGGLGGRSCLDAGTGKGQFAIALRALGAHAVTGIDLVPSTIRELRSRYPEIEWRSGSVVDETTITGLAPFDVIFALEVLQYVALGKFLALWWPLVAPGGRLIGLVPNRDCPIVQKTVERFRGLYAPCSVPDLAGGISSLDGLGMWSMRGCWFRSDQRIAPYEISQWTTAPAWQSPPNRLLFVAERTAKKQP